MAVDKRVRGAGIRRDNQGQLWRGRVRARSCPGLSPGWAGLPTGKKQRGARAAAGREEG